MRQTTGQPTDGQTDTGHSLTDSVRWGAGLLWTASAVWTTVSIHHVIGNWVTSGVVTALVESAYVLATIWFHHDRNWISGTALFLSLVPVVAALVAADHDMFGPVGIAFAAGPVIAEGGFLLAAHLGRDQAELTPEQQLEVAEMQREAAHRAAVRAATLDSELADIKAEAIRQMALDSAAAEVQMRRNDLGRQLTMSAPTVSEPTVLSADKSVGQTDTVSEQVSATVSRTVVPASDRISDNHEVSVSRDKDKTITDVAVSGVRLSAVGSLSAAVRDAVTDNPDITNAELVEVVSKQLGSPQVPASVARTRLRHQPRTA